MEYATTNLKEAAVKAHLNGQDVTLISKMFNVHRATIYRWIERSNDAGSLERRKTPGSGRPSKLTSQETKKLTKLILKPASKYGYDTDFWTIRRIISVAKKHLNFQISKTTMHEILNEVNYSYKKPEKRYYEANEEEQKQWIKKIIPKIKKLIKKNNAILYFEDEANVSLNAVLGKTWGPVGVKTIHKAAGKKASISAMSALSVHGRLIFTLHEKRITSIEIINFLDQMLKQHPRRHLIVVMDNAPPHTSCLTKDYIESQKKLHVFYLPARSPEFNADEKVWNHLKNEELKSHQARNKDELKKLTCSKLRKMSKKPKLLRALFMRSEVSAFFN